jgi:hypothetical protein
MDETNIIAITDAGIRCRDEDGGEHFIAFTACYQRFVDRLYDPENVRAFRELNRIATDEELEAALARIRSGRKVADRDVFAPYLSFYTDPPARFDFTTRAELDKVLYAIRQAGWRTFDKA